ncbi:uncharacterized protein LOC124540703 [Vanessa cardui]|uniref:uncharacterized protein LOC124540703 n=1 Tax=Vanessa cardui TaxID=171605 RepID=UPI001F1367C1|nr:uncharacterized protein LOC124540703 [Vanessa cardui]
MRRNRDFDNNHHQPSPGGPLMTNHLRDLDIELELLKRKREIIQQEQEMLSRFSSKRQYDYEHRSNTYDRQESNNRQFNTNNFPNRYDGPSNSGNFTRPQGVKRQTPNQYWQPPTAPKRFTAPQKINPWQNSHPRQETGFPIRKTFPSQTGNGNIGGSIRPLMSIRPGISQRIQNKSQVPRKDFKPSKVTKPKPHQAPNKLSAHAVAETKKLVSQVDTADKKVDSDQILRVDKTPTVQMKGRLELALGTIMKEIKNEHCANPKDIEHFQSPFIQRLLKHAIRTRIRSVMIDQVVGNFSDIVTKYRKKFPKETDLELVQIAKDAQSLSSKSIGVAQLIESDDPQDFYNKNMLKALYIKFEEIFENLEKLYQNKGKDLDEYIKNMPEPKKVDKDKAQNQSTEHINPGKEKINLENLIGEGDTVKVINERLEKVKMYREFMDELIEQRLPKILPKFKDALLSIILTDKEFLVTKSMIMSQLKKKLNRSFDKDIDVEFTSSSPNTTATSSPEAAVKKSMNTSETSTDSSVEKLSDTKALPTDNSTDAGKPLVSPPHSSPIKSPTNATPQAIANNTTESANASTEQANPKTPPKSDDLHYVKLISRPNLPARAVIYDFLKQFKPASIKKHKSINNLLVIGFTNKEDYDKILEVNESVVGNATILIKASEQVTKTKQSTPSQEEGDESVSKSASNSLLDDSLLGSDLETQITDLLTSIRKANESDDGSDANKSGDKIDATGKIEKTQANVKSTTENTNTAETNESADAAKAEEKLDTAKANETIKVENNEEKTSEDAVVSETAEEKKKEQNTTPITDTKVITTPVEDKNQKELEKITELSEEQKNNTEISGLPEKADGDKMKDTLKESGRATPTRSSSRIASSTPSTIRTRRASRLAQNN